jgi:SAM-dependent methyltransferase
MVPVNFNPGISHPLYYIRKGLYRKISLYAPQMSGDLLDFGCGEKPYKSLFTNVQSYTGLDYDSEGHNHANESIDVYYDGVTIPFEANHFDSIFTSEVFEHVFTLPQILPELNRVLKMGGKILITCPFSWEEHEVPIDYARYTQFALIDMLEKNGFKIQTIDKNGHFLSALHQLFVLYISDHWIHRVFFFSQFNFFKKIVRQIVIPVMNIFFSIVEPILPKSDKFYLNTIIIAQKCS